MVRVLKVTGDEDAVLDAIQGRPQVLRELDNLLGAMDPDERMAFTLGALAGLDEDEALSAMELSRPELSGSELRDLMSRAEQRATESDIAPLLQAWLESAEVDRTGEA